MKKHKHHPETEAVRGGTGLEKKNGPLTTPIYQTSTFEVTDNKEQVRATHGQVLHALRKSHAHRSRTGDCGTGRRRRVPAFRLGHGGDYDFAFWLC